MKRIKLTFTAILLLTTVINAQETTTTEEFVPSGKPAVKIFSNAHTTFVDGDNTSAFEIKRAYFGYKYSFSENFSTKITLDVGDPAVGKLQMTAFLKNAALIYKKDKLTANFGLIGLYGFKVQEKHWGYRYIYKSLQDEHEFGSSADLGASFAYKFSDFISVDGMILNGEGYKNLQSDDTYKGAIGVTISPVKNFDVRMYYDLMSADVAQQTIALFAGYKSDKFRVGGEYNLQKNHKMNKGEDLTGISFYTTVIASEKFNFFGRFDNLISSTLSGAADPWHIDDDGQLYMLGLEYNPVKGVKIAPNFQGWNPKKDGGEFESSIYLNVEVSF